MLGSLLLYGVRRGHWDLEGSVRGESQERPREAALAFLGLTLQWGGETWLFLGALSQVCGQWLSTMTHEEVVISEQPWLPSD